MRARLGVAAALSVALLVVAAACGVPGDSDFRAIDPADIPYGLNETTTTTTVVTTTSTSTTSTTVVVPTSTTEPATTTSTLPVEPVALFWVSGNELFPSSRLLLSPAAPAQVLSALAEGPPEGDISAGLRSALPSGVEPLASVERGVATVELPPSFITDVPGAEQRLAIAQIVLTLTRRGGIGQVTFTLGGTPTAVPRGRGDLAEPGDLLSCEDYENLLGPGLGC
jgi:spore germination protein GerM